MSAQDPASFVDEHPRKTQLERVEVDSNLGADTGWVDMRVQFLVTRESLGSEHTVLGFTRMPPGSRHESHRHPNAEEICYVTAGQGVYRIGDDWVSMKVGDIALSPKNEVHAFWNTSETEDLEMVWTYGGAASLEEAGYVQVHDQH